MFRGAQQTCLGPHHLKVSQGRLASPGCVHWSLLSPEPREKIRAVSHRSTRHALSSAWNTVSVTQPRLSLHSLVHTMDLSLHSSIFGWVNSLLGLERELCLSFYGLVQHNTTRLSPQSFVHTKDLSSQTCPLRVFHTEKGPSPYIQNGLCTGGHVHVTSCSLEASRTRRLSLQTLASEGLSRRQGEHLSQN